MNDSLEFLILVTKYENLVEEITDKQTTYLNKGIKIERQTAIPAEDSIIYLDYILKNSYKFIKICHDIENNNFYKKLPQEQKDQFDDLSKQMRICFGDLTSAIFNGLFENDPNLILDMIEKYKD